MFKIITVGDSVLGQVLDASQQSVTEEELRGLVRRKIDGKAIFLLPNAELVEKWLDAGPLPGEWCMVYCRMVVFRLPDDPKVRTSYGRL